MLYNVYLDRKQKIINLLLLYVLILFQFVQFALKHDRNSKNWTFWKKFNPERYVCLPDDHKRGSYALKLSLFGRMSSHKIEVFWHSAKCLGKRHTPFCPSAHARSLKIGRARELLWCAYWPALISRLRILLLSTLPDSFLV